MTWSNKLKAIGRMYAGLTSNAYHHRRPAGITAPWIVWSENGAEGFMAGNSVEELGMTGTTDLYTLDEFDDLIDRIHDAQNALDGFVWNLNSIQYEDETNLIHYEWTWSFIG